MTSVLKVDNIQNSSGTSAISIDSSGNVTYPSNTTPHVLVTMSTNTTGAYQAVTSGSPFPFTTVGEGDSSLWNTSTYKFTCPSDGIYQVTFYGLTNASDNFTLHLYKNGSSFTRFFHNADRTFHGTIAIKCSSGDVLHWQAGNDRSFYNAGYTSTAMHTFGTITRIGD